MWLKLSFDLRLERDIQFFNKDEWKKKRNQLYRSFWYQNSQSTPISDALIKSIVYNLILWVSAVFFCSIFQEARYSGSSLWLFRTRYSGDSQSAAGPWTPPCPSWSFTAGQSREPLPGPGTILRAVPPTGRRPTDRPTDLELCCWTSVRPSSRSGPKSLSFHHGGGRSCSVPGKETRAAGAAAAAAHLLKVTSSPVSFLPPPPPPPHLFPSSPFLFSFARCCLVFECARARLRFFRFSTCASTSSSSPGRPGRRRAQEVVVVKVAGLHVTKLAVVN